MDGSRKGIARRTFVTRAVALGGAGALTACLDREGEPSVPVGPEDPSALPERQHAWNDVLDRDDHDNVLPPRHHVILLLNYVRDGHPRPEDRSTVAAAIDDLERTTRRGADGLLVTIGYSTRYFARFDEPLPEPVDLPAPTALSSFENPMFDRPDAIVHLASDHGSLVLAAERTLLGERDEVNGVGVSTNLADVFAVEDRRTGFVGAGLPADRQDVRGIPDSSPVPEDAPLFMGFKSGYDRNQATEDRVTIERGPFAGGSTQHLSHLRLNLEQWYEQDSRLHRVATMFCPVHAEDDLVEGPGDNLGTSSRIEERGCPAHAAEDARERGVVGHSQKAARAREDGDPIILRRDFNSTDDGEAGLHFLSIQRGIGDFVATRTAMNGTDLAASGAVGERTNNGILQYFTVRRRGNYLLPPRRHRALPSPSPA